MILHYKNIKISKNKIKIQKKISYSKDIAFFPIKYDDNDFVIQTPVMYSPFGIYKYKENKYIDLSFQYNKVTDLFINDCLNIFYNKVNKVFKANDIDDYIKINKYSKWIRLKINNIHNIYNQNKELIENIKPQRRGSFIIHLSGIWLINNKIHFNWILLQSKIYEPITLKEYVFIEEDISNNIIKKRIPPPPPLPPPPPDNYKRMLKIGIPKIIIENKKNADRINSKNAKKKDIHRTPSLDEIMLAIKNLQKVK